MTTSIEGKPPLRRLTDEELKSILDEHAMWLETNGEKGKQADLSYVDFTRQNREEALLQWNMLRKADLRHANFLGASLRGAVLSKINLSGAALKRVDFVRSQFINANLKEAHLVESNLQMADFSGANMQKARLYKANLQDGNFLFANFEDSSITHANLQKAKFNMANLKSSSLFRTDVRYADFEGADLQMAYLAQIKNLNNANLHNCNLQNATGLKGNEFAGADITGAKLPDDIKQFKTLDIVEENSKNARKIFLAMLLACVYSWLTIGSTDDVALLTNSSSSPLPIIGTPIPIATFLIIAPILLVGFYLYMHLYLWRLWKNLACLPAIFEDGKRLDERAYPWLLNGLVRRHFKKLKKGRILIDWIEEIISIFLAWWIVPITVIMFWLRYLPRHDWTWTFIQIILIILSVIMGVLIYGAHKCILRGKDMQIFS